MSGRMDLGRVVLERGSEECGRAATSGELWGTR